MSILSGIGDQLKAAGGALVGSDYLRDYRHAAKTFRSKSYAFTPKYKFLFHTYFNINTQAWDPKQSSEFSNFGILVKDISLPKYGFNTVQLNQYNRKRIIQTKIRYEPINITFHDDNNNTINKLWYAYYTYYYQDAKKPNVMFAGNRGDATPKTGINNEQQPTMADYNVSNIYKTSTTAYSDWGYYGEATNSNVVNGSEQKLPFFQNITVFGFNQHNFTAYTLINPIITAFGHDTYNYEEGGGVMKNTMTIDYETVVYNEGALDGKKPEDIVSGFGAVENYDRKLSPIALPGSNATILGPNGLVDGAGGFVNSFKSGNYLQAVTTGARLFNTAKNMDLVSTAKYELMNMLAQSAWEYGSPIARNRNIQFDIPNKSVTPYTIGVAGAPTIAPPETKNVVAMPNKAAVATAGVQVTSTPNIRG